jgi:hypothetical protein
MSFRKTANHFSPPPTRPAALVVRRSRYAGGWGTYLSCATSKETEMQHTPRRQDATFGPARRFMPLDAPPPAPRPENALASLLGAFLGLLRFWVQSARTATRPARPGDGTKQQRKKKEQKK